VSAGPRWARRLKAEPQELRAAAWSAAQFGCLLASYFALRPIRDEMGVQAGIERLPELVTWTLGGMLVLNPAFSALASRWPRRVFLPWALRAFALMLVGWAAWAGFGSSQGNLGFAKTTEDVTFSRMRDELMKEVERHFRPEFLNRVDEIIVFKPLTRVDLESIIDIEMRGLAERLSQRNVEIALTPEARTYIIDQGFNPEYGARPLRRAIQRIIEDPLAEEVLRGSFPEGSRIMVTYVNGRVGFSREPLSTATPPPPPAPPVPPAPAGATAGPAEGAAPSA